MYFLMYVYVYVYGCTHVVFFGVWLSVMLEALLYSYLLLF